MSTQQTISVSTNHTTGLAYIATYQGIFKILEIVCSLTGALFAGIQFYGYIIDIFLFASSISSISAFIFLVIYLTGFVGKTGSVINRIQFFFHSIWAIYYFIAVILLWSHSGGGGNGRIVAAGFFGFVASAAHILDGVDNYKKCPIC